MKKKYVKKLGYMKTNIYLCFNQLIIDYMSVNKIDKWSDEQVEKVFTCVLDEMTFNQASYLKRKYSTIQGMRYYLKKTEKKFIKNLVD
jgi:ABC-type proline/glycine betaine transport system ATPase subunit